MSQVSNLSSNRLKNFNNQLPVLNRKIKAVHNSVEVGQFKLAYEQINSAIDFALENDLSLYLDELYELQDGIRTMIASPKQNPKFGFLSRRSKNRSSKSRRKVGRPRGSKNKRSKNRKSRRKVGRPKGSGNKRSKNRKSKRKVDRPRGSKNRKSKSRHKVGRHKSSGNKRSKSRRVKLRSR